MTSCTRHVLGFALQQHAWNRQVTNSELLEVPATDQWGRRFDESHVMCHIQYVCRNCGETREGSECSCDRNRGDTCPARVASLAGHRSH